MKKILLLLAVTTASVSTAFSQKFEWGVKTGMQITPRQSYTAIIGLQKDKMAGFYFGVLAEQPIGKVFSVQGELLYSDVRESYQKYHYHLHELKYLVLPIMGKLYPVKNLSLEFGPQFGYLLEDEVRDHPDKEFDFSIGMGASYKIAGRFELSFRYNAGLTKVDEGAVEHNNATRIGFGYRF